MASAPFGMMYVFYMCLMCSKGTVRKYVLYTKCFITTITTTLLIHKQSLKLRSTDCCYRLSLIID